MSLVTPKFHEMVYMYSGVTKIASIFFHQRFLLQNAQVGISGEKHNLQNLFNTHEIVHLFLTAIYI